MLSLCSHPLLGHSPSAQHAGSVGNWQGFSKRWMEKPDYLMHEGFVSNTAVRSPQRSHKLRTCSCMWRDEGMTAFCHSQQQRSGIERQKYKISAHKLSPLVTVLPSVDSYCSQNFLLPPNPSCPSLHLCWEHKHPLHHTRSHAAPPDPASLILP